MDNNKAQNKKNQKDKQLHHEEENKKDSTASQSSSTKEEQESKKNPQIHSSNLLLSTHPEGSDSSQKHMRRKTQIIDGPTLLKLKTEITSSSAKNKLIDQNEVY